MTITINSIVEWFTTAHTMQLLLALLVLGALYTLIQLSRNNDTLNLSDLVTVNGRLDEKKFSRFGAWVISTWAFVYLIVNGPSNFPEWYFIGYMGVWVMNAETRYRQSSQTYIQDPANRVPQVPQKEL